MRNDRRLLFFISFYFIVGVSSTTYAGVTSTGERIEIFGELDEGDVDADGAGSSDFVSFSETVLATGTGQSAGGSVTCTDLSGGGQLVYTGSGQISSSATSVGPEIDPVSGLEFFVTFEVTGEAVPFQLIVDTVPSFSGETALSQVRVSLSGSTDQTFSLLGSCSSFEGCSNFNVNESRLLPPGFYGLSIRFSAGAGQGGNQSGVSGSWSLTVGDACILAWSDPAGGDFSDPENWSPAEVPEATEDGCVNLILNEPGAYAITLPDDATANSLTVAAGEPSLLGGDLTLMGVEFPDALSVLNEARLTVESGSLQSGSVLVSGTGAGKGEAQPAFLRVKPGAVLRAFNNLEVGRGIGEAGELVLGDGAEQTVFSMLGDVTLGGAGKSTVFGNGNLNFGVFGDLLMGVFDGSQSNLNLNGDAAQLRAVEFFVFGASIIGGQGSAALSLSGLNVGTMDSLRMGTLAGGEGTLNLSGADCQLDVANSATIGLEGRADVTVSGAARLNAASMVVGSGEVVDPSVVTVTGELSQLAVSGDIDAGAGLGALVVAEGAKLTATNLNIDGSTPGALGTLGISGSSTALEPAVEVAETLTVGGVGDGSWGMSGSGTVMAKNLAIGVLAEAIGLATFSGDTDVSTGLRLPTIKVAEVAQIGLDGRGTFESTGASAYEFGQLWLGVGPTGEASYTSSGAFALTTVTGQMLLGVQGRASVTLTSGGFLAGACALGAGTGGLGELRLFAGASMLLNPVEVPNEGEGSPESGAKEDVAAPGFLEVGRQSNGLIELFDDVTRLRCDEAIIGGNDAAAGGTVNIDTGATFECFGSVTMGANLGPALVRVADRAGMTIGSILIIGPKGLFIAGGGSNVNAGFVSIEGRFKIEDALSIERPADKSGFTVQPKGNGTGNGPAVIDGDLEIGPDGVLEVTAGAGEALVVTGATTLDGTLEITLQPGSTFTDGQLLDLINFQGGTTGNFASVVFLNAPEGFEGAVEFEDGTLRLRVISGGTVEPEGEGEGSIEGEGQASVIHSADQDSDERISLSELLRVIQFYNALGLHCVTVEGESEDGYIAGANEAAENCTPHDSDFAPQDWTINLSELLQLIQLYNANGYEPCEAPEGFCPVFP